MTGQEFKERISNSEYIAAHKFELLAELNRQLSINIEEGRDLLVRLLEYRSDLQGFEPMLSSLLEKAGLYPYINENVLSELGESAAIAYEYHRPDNLRNIVLHSEQMAVYQRLQAGENIILSAPTSFGKSLLIDAMIASKKYKKIVVIVPTIALIDETRKRLSEKFSNEYIIITHPPALDFENVVYILTQERFLEFQENLLPDFFIIDEFYKLNGPADGKERVVSLNKAFLNLCQTRAQFLLIGPNIQGVQSGDSKVEYSFIRTDFRTVATDIISVNHGGRALDDCCVDIAKGLEEPTLIFCKSRGSAYSLATKMILNGLGCLNDDTRELAEWLRHNFHREWELPEFIENGIGVHHASLPRSLSSYMLTLFNAKKIKYLLCTSTIIEGVNTSAKNIIIYDNKIANRKFDYFTFNNIKGRAGRMFQYFVGRVFVLSPPPEEELPEIDIPALTLSDSTPVQIVLDVQDEGILSERTAEQLRYLHSQSYLDFEILQRNSFICPYQMIDVAKKISQKTSRYASILNWTGIPDKNQLDEVCSLIFNNFCSGKKTDGISSYKQLSFKIFQLMYCMPMGIKNLIFEQAKNKEFCASPTKAVEDTLFFLRRWAEFYFPRFLLALNDVQQCVFKKINVVPGDYTAFAEKVKRWFLPLSATVLEEYGVPLQVSLKIEEKNLLGETPSEVLKKMGEIDFEQIPLSSIERKFLGDFVKTS